MKLHSINQNNKRAIIEHMGQLVEVAYTLIDDTLMLTDSMKHYDLNGLDSRVAYKLINDYLSSTREKLN